MIALESILIGGNYHNKAALSKATDIPASTLYRYEKNLDKAPFGVIKKLAKAQGYKIKFIREEREY